MMQTYTHFFIGGAIGTILFPDNLLAQGACAAGAVVPDIPAFAKMAIDIATGQPPLKNQSKGFILIKEIAHSIPLWFFALIAMAFATRYWPGLIIIAGLAFIFGGISHLPIDALTHTNPRFAKEDLGMMWPFGYPDFRLRIGNWDYRIDYGVLKPKPFEAFVNIVFLSFIVWRWL